MKIVGKQLAVEAANRQTVTSVVPLTGNVQTWNASNKDELFYLNPAGTLATQTFVFPADAASVIGQQLSIVTTQILTATTLTATGLTLKGTMTTLTLTNGTVVAVWTKVAAATWARTQ